MPATKREQELIELVEPLVDQHDLELVDLEVVGGSKSPTIRVYLDRPGEGGIAFDDLAAANQWLGDAIEERDPFPGAYVLEVSSPGIDRPLRKLEDYRRFAGEEVAIRLEKEAIASHGGKGSLAGVLMGVEDGLIAVKTGGSTQRLGLEDIRKAHVKGHVDFSRKD